MAELALLYVPFLFILLLSASICRLVIFWQMERSVRVMAFLVVFVSFGVLVLGTTIKLPETVRTVTRCFLIGSLVIGNYLDWHALIVFLHKKYERKVVAAAAEIEAPLPVTKTLAAIAGEHSPVQLNATEPAPKAETAPVPEPEPAHFA